MSNKKIVAAVFATVFMIVMAILNPFRSASAEPAPRTTYSWDPCTPVVWSYTNNPGWNLRQNIKMYKGTLNATRTVAKLSGYSIHEAMAGEVPNVDIRWTSIDATRYGEVNLSSNAFNIIDHGDLRLNTITHFQRKRDQKFLVMHEFGHIFGLEHTTTPAELMSDVLLQVPFVSITQDDIDAFAALPDCA